LKLIANSPWGLILRAIRGDEATCQAAGINVTFYKIASLMISAAVAGLGGALLLNVLTETLRGLSEYRLWVYTLLLVFILFFLPQGAIAPLWRRIRRVFA